MTEYRPSSASGTGKLIDVGIYNKSKGSDLPSYLSKIGGDASSRSIAIGFAVIVMVCAPLACGVFVYANNYRP